MPPAAREERDAPGTATEAAARAAWSAMGGSGAPATSRAEPPAAAWDSGAPASTGGDSSWDGAYYGSYQQAPGAGGGNAPRASAGGAADAAGTSARGFEAGAPSAWQGGARRPSAANAEWGEAEEVGDWGQAGRVRPVGGSSGAAAAGDAGSASAPWWAAPPPGGAASTGAYTSWAGADGSDQAERVGSGQGASTSGGGGDAGGSWEAAGPTNWTAGTSTYTGSFTADADSEQWRFAYDPLLGDASGAPQGAPARPSDITLITPRDAVRPGGEFRQPPPPPRAHVAMC